MPADDDHYEQLGPPKGGRPTTKPATTKKGAVDKRVDAVPAETPEDALLNFALRPGDDVDLSSERPTNMSGSVEGIGKKSKETISAEGKKSQEAESAEKEKDREKDREKEDRVGSKKKLMPLGSRDGEPKVYEEPRIWKVCYIATQILLGISILLTLLALLQFVDVFVWLPMLFGD